MHVHTIMQTYQKENNETLRFQFHVGNILSFGIEVWKRLFPQVLTGFEVIEDGAEMLVHFIGAHDLHKDI